MTSARSTQAIVIAALASAAMLSVPSRGASAGESAIGYDDATGKILSEEVFTDAPLEFELPADLSKFIRRPTQLRTNGGISIGASCLFVVLNDEQGASKDFAGSGTGAEFELFMRSRKGWDLRLGYSLVAEGLYSEVDMAEAQLERYVLGFSLPLARGKSFGLTLGGGLAWNQLDIVMVDPNADIAGPGGFVDLGLTISLGRNLGVEVKGRYISWQGESGVGEQGAEQSSVVSAGISLGF